MYKLFEVSRTATFRITKVSQTETIACGWKRRPISGLTCFSQLQKAKLLVKCENEIDFSVS
jgi:hypothetical protein